MDDEKRLAEILWIAQQGFPVPAEDAAFLFRLLTERTAELERVTHLNGVLTNDFNSMLIRESRAVDRAEQAEAELSALEGRLDDLLSRYPASITEWADGIRAALSSPSPVKEKSRG